MTKLNRYISNSNIKLRDNASFWFDNDSRRRYIYELASEVMVQAKLSPEVALHKAQQLDKLFYDRYYNPTTRKELNNG